MATSRAGMKKWLLIVTAAIAVLQFAQSQFHIGTVVPADTPAASATPGAAQNLPRVARDSSDAVSRAFQERRRDVQVSGTGTVVRILGDLQGSRHQRFLLRMPSGQTVLIAHNIDLAPRLDALRSGEKVAFSGEYEWNERGGVVHWTHRDPDGRHRAGWLLRNGKKYQ